MLKTADVYFTTLGRIRPALTEVGGCEHVNVRNCSKAHFADTDVKAFLLKVKCLISKPKVCLSFLRSV